MSIIVSINEWSESPQYIIGKWYKDLEKQIKKWFNDELSEFEFNYFEYNVSSSSMIYVGTLYFNDAEYMHKLEIIIDSAEITAEDNIIEELTIKFYSYLEDETVFEYEDVIEADLLTDNYILKLVSKTYEKD
jgi:hypothetical protein